MIQQKELRVGNYVHVPTLDNELYEMSTISRYGRDCSVTDNKLGYQSSILDIENINPIPLSEEWLINLGFEEDMSTFYYNAKIASIYLHTPYSGSKNWNVKANGGDKLTSVQYVHQLQNLFYVLTGEDLAFNTPK